MKKGSPGFVSHAHRGTGWQSKHVTGNRVGSQDGSPDTAELADPVVDDGFPRYEVDGQAAHDERRRVQRTQGEKKAKHRGRVDGMFYRVNFGVEAPGPSHRIRGAETIDIGQPPDREAHARELTSCKEQAGCSTIGQMLLPRIWGSKIAVHGRVNPSTANLNPPYPNAVMAAKHHEPRPLYHAWRATTWPSTPSDSVSGDGFRTAVQI